MCQEEIETHADRLLKLSSLNSGITVREAVEKTGLPRHKAERLASILERGGLADVEPGLFKTMIRARI